MASVNTFYARPVYVKQQSDLSLPSRGNFSQHVQEGKANVSKIPVQNLYKKSLSLDRKRVKNGQTSLADTRRRKLPVPLNDSPPPRPPPPRPEKATALRETTPERESPHHDQTTPEPKPLTKTNVTTHDQIWQRDEESSVSIDGLTPPMKYITPETTKEMWKNYDPVDVLDSASDSSADTMIMMTTEEEKKNDEKIKHSLKEYKTVKFQEVPTTNKLKLNMQNGGSSGTHGILRTNTRGSRMPEGNKTRSQLDTGVTRISDSIHDVQGTRQSGSHVTGFNSTPISSKISPLHVKTDTDNNSSPESVSNKTNSKHGSPNDDSPDDGYGTNSSSGTSVSSPFSSSFSSVFMDLENSGNGGTKGPVLPNGAIKPNSVRENWAVKRKQRMIDAQDNSVQEQLRQLAIIEEEGNGGIAATENQESQNHNVNLLQHGIDKLGVNVICPGITDERQGRDQANGTDQVSQGDRRYTSQSSVRQLQQEDPPYVNVSQTEIAQRNKQLYVVDGESGRKRRLLPTPPKQGRSQQAWVGYASASEINVPTNGTRPSDRALPAQGSNIDRIYDEVYEPSSGVPRRSEPVVRPNVLDQPAIVDGRYQNELVRGETDSRYSTNNGSGNIYVSPSGDEGFYALNRIETPRTLSVASDDNIKPSLQQQSSLPSPSSPLENMSGELLEKWSDMDRNYRNYCGFNEQDEFRMSDSKVNYFHQKTLKNKYGQDNYYRPENYNRHHHKQPSLSYRMTSDGRPAEPVLPLSPIETINQKPAPAASSSSSSSSSSSKNKLFQILPNMFKPSNHKKHNTEKDKTSKKGKSAAFTITQTAEEEESRRVILDHEHDQEAEYVNMQDLPQYGMVNIERENALRRGQYVSVESLHKRPVFASSKDIRNLFSTQGQNFDSIHNPGNNRHSFHAMPLSYRHVSRENVNVEDMRPRASSTSATMRTPSQLRNSIESRMAVLQRKSQGQPVTPYKTPNVISASSMGNLSNASNSSGRGGQSRHDSSGSSNGGEPKLSTLV